MLELRGPSNRYLGCLIFTEQLVHMNRVLLSHTMVALDELFVLMILWARAHAICLKVVLVYDDVSLLGFKLL